MALTSSKVWNIKCILILISLVVICSAILIAFVFGKTMKRLRFSLLDRFNHWALKEGEGLGGCLIFTFQGQPKLEEESAGLKGNQ